MNVKRMFHHTFLFTGPSGFIQLGGGWYKFLTDTERTWQEAREACYSLGATLITFNSQIEIDVIDAHVANNGMYVSYYGLQNCRHPQPT